MEVPICRVNRLSQYLLLVPTVNMPNVYTVHIYFPSKMILSNAFQLILCIHKQVSSYATNTAKMSTYWQF